MPRRLYQMNCNLNLRFPMRNPDDVRTLELKVPPLVLVIIAAVSMWTAGRLVREFHFQFPFLSLVGWSFGLLGIVVCTLGVAEFKRAKTTVNPTKPQTSSSLVRSGIYRQTRNPMYLGFLLILTGWATSTGTMLSFIGLPAFVLYMNRFQIKPEERALSSIFGYEFIEYRNKVRRWV